MVEVRYYLTIAGKNVFESWVSSLKDDQAEARIATRINRLMHGNFGDCKPVGEGVWELRINWGPGYRLYLGRDGDKLVILLTGGAKQRQSADIERAKELWSEYKTRR